MDLDNLLFVLKKAIYLTNQDCLCWFVWDDEQLFLLKDTQHLQESTG